MRYGLRCRAAPHGTATHRKASGVNEPYESDRNRPIAITNISHRLPHVVAGKQLALMWNEEIRLLSPYPFNAQSCQNGNVE